MLKKIIISLFAISIFATSINAGVFVLPVESKYLQTANEVIVIDKDGKEITGETRMVTMVGTMIKKITIRDDQKVKYKYSPENVKLLKMKLSKIAKAENVASNASRSIKSAVETDYSALMEKGYAVWENVPNEDGDGFYLLQILNPGFSAFLKVYEKPEIITTSSGGSNNGFSFNKPKLPEKFLVVKNGKTIEVEDDDYDDELYPALFGDSPEMMKLAEKDRDFEDFEDHVFKYDELMSKKQ